MKKLGIIGSGVMGTDIGQLAAESGLDVVLNDIDEARMRDSFKCIQSRLNRYVKERRIDKGSVGDITSKIKLHKDLRNFEDADIVIECADEDMAIKKSIFKQLDEICNAAAVLASNTSSISITEIASATKRPESVIGIHFLMPARVMKLVELIPGFATTRETFEMAKIFIKQLGKIEVESRDFPGFLLNRMLFPLLNEAIYLLYEGAGTVESIDKVIKHGLNMPMGPLELADLIGLDVVLAVSEEMYRGYSDTKYRPCPLLKKYVAAGHLGKKTGRGFHLY